MRLIWLAALFVSATAISAGTPTQPVPGYIAKAVADPRRPEGDRKLDPLRKPGQVLAYAGVKPGQVIGEYLPGGGYYTRLLSDVVGRRGRVYALETKVDVAAFNHHVFDSLKTGGTYFIVDHAAMPGSGTAGTPKLHRIDQATVIEEVKAAGFVLVGESDLLRNPADDHTKTVFDPSIRWKTDQFILKFRKPRPELHGEQAAR